MIPHHRSHDNGTANQRGAARHFAENDQCQKNGSGCFNNAQQVSDHAAIAEKSSATPPITIRQDNRKVIETRSRNQIQPMIPPTIGTVLQISVTCATDVSLKAVMKAMVPEALISDRK